jgi:hypothetical protein
MSRDFEGFTIPLSTKTWFWNGVWVPQNVYARCICVCTYVCIHRRAVPGEYEHSSSESRNPSKDPTTNLSLPRTKNRHCFG